jgi:hypothetical protein
MLALSPLLPSQAREAGTSSTDADSRETREQRLVEGAAA